MKNKKWIKVTAIVAAVLIGLGILKDQLIRGAVIVGASAVVGAPVRVGHFGVGVFRSAVRIKNFRLYNPPGFPKEPLINIPEVSVEYDIPALLGGKISLPLLVINVKELTVIKDKDGNLNVDALKVAQQAERQKGKASVKEKKPAGKMDMQIDKMTLKVGRVIYKDFSKGEKPSIYAYNIDIDKTFTNIKSAEALVTTIVVESMGPTAIQGAKIYGAAMILGVGFLPAGVAGVLIGNADAAAEWTINAGKIYEAAVRVIKEAGELQSEDPAAQTVKGRVEGANVVVQIDKTLRKKTKITVTSRKMMVPKPELAGGILYRIEQTLK